MDAVFDLGSWLALLAVSDEGELVVRLRVGDDDAFATLVGMYQTRLLRLAATVVVSRSVAEEVVQDTWLAVVRGVDRFEGRSSFKTWLFHILLNRARTTAGREHRTAALPDGDLDDRFDGSGAWASPPVPWSDQVEDRVVADRLARRVREILPTLPDVQRQVVVLRDIEGVAPADVCELLGVTDGQSARAAASRAGTDPRAARGGDGYDMRMPFWSRRRALVCRQAVELMAGYLDGALTARDRARLEAHLADCPHCSEYLAQLRATIDTLGRVEPDDLPEEALDELVALYRRWRAE